ncbi:sulfotransferase [Prosthecochloris sp. GSB1]|uniref:sulfotransferase family protein n=1 Tax=Prosthecochloris sp. GSB1 TaxID=281093 RepID=UPI000B8C750A|nr:sulfotransferase [Prosthecochloris sp. GSB1]ASQ89832.1 sulfotransferase [Prosthecochloris sp. GSB1]
MKSPVFLLSLPRSGSTLLQRVLMGHSQIASVAEPWILLPFLYAGRTEGVLAEYSHANACKAHKDFVNNLPGKTRDYYSILHDFLMTLYSYQCKNNELFFLDKTPRYHLIIPEITMLFPEAKFVFLFRNPVHVMGSVMRTWGDGGFRKNYAYENDLYEGPMNLSEGFRILKDRAYALRYEDFVNAPERYTREICDYLGLCYEQGMLEGFSSRNPKGRMGDPTGVLEYSEVETGALNKWRETFNNGFRKKILRKYLASLDSDDLLLMGYDRCSILHDIARLPGGPSGVVRDALDYGIGRVIKKLKLNIWFGRKTGPWAGDSFLS